MNTTRAISVALPSHAVIVRENKTKKNKIKVSKEEQKD
jgi:hypothetical protein